MELNLDCETSEYLMHFWLHHQGGRNAKTLGLSGKGSRRTTGALANYAANKATAMRLRKQGFIANAMDYERICDRIYETLPESARW